MIYDSLYQIRGFEQEKKTMSLHSLFTKHFAPHCKDHIYVFDQPQKCNLLLFVNNWMHFFYCIESIHCSEQVCHTQ